MTKGRKTAILLASIEITQGLSMIADMSLCNGLQTTNAEVIHMYPHDYYRQQRPQRLNNSWKVAYIEPPLHPRS